MEADRAAERAVKEAKRVCGLIAKMVRDFWQNVDKVVEIRVQVCCQMIFFCYICTFLRLRAFSSVGGNGCYEEKGVRPTAGADGWAR